MALLLTLAYIVENLDQEEDIDLIVDKGHCAAFF
jgi:hypothetical protein